MKTKNLIQWYVNGDNNIMIATDSHGLGWNFDVTYTAMTREDLITMLESLGADVCRKRETKTVYLDNNAARLNDGPVRYDQYEKITVTVREKLE